MKNVRKVAAVCMALVIVLSSFTCVFAEEKTVDVSDYKVTVTLDESEFTGVRVDLMSRDGKNIRSWELAEKGKLTADLTPGSYTLRQVIEINGYEFPSFSNFMVGGAIIVPVDPNGPIIKPTWPENLPDIIPELTPVYPDYVPENGGLGPAYSY